MIGRGSARFVGNLVPELGNHLPGHRRQIELSRWPQEYKKLCRALTLEVVCCLGDYGRGLAFQPSFDELADRRRGKGFTVSLSRQFSQRLANRVNWKLALADLFVLLGDLHRFLAIGLFS